MHAYFINYIKKFFFCIFLSKIYKDDIDLRLMTWFYRFESTL